MVTIRSSTINQETPALKYKELQITTKKNFKNFKKDSTRIEPLIDEYNPRKLKKIINKFLPEEKIDKKKGFVSIDILTDAGYRNVKISYDRHNKLQIPDDIDEIMSGHNAHPNIDIYAIFIRIIKYK